MQTQVTIDGTRIQDWNSFHEIFAKAFGFPNFYGKNMNAWIDCMTSLDSPEDGMTNIHVASGQCLILEIANAKELSMHCPEIFQALVDCVAFVNFRRLEVGEPAVLTLSYYK